ncbi:MAG: hypothetical protein HOJ35_05680 [Bdellovibrionales bacterium]|nr:hypothetical protein [Bdellovibrionales bacterium]
MSFIYFLVRHTPFWSLPTILITLQFTIRFWKKSYKKLAIFLFFISTISFLTTVYYFWAGGPELSVRKLMDFVNS